MSLTVMTYSSMGESVANKLVRSCQVYGYDLTFIGKDTGFRDFRQIKIDLVLESLRQVSTEYAMYTDAPDSWFLSSDILKTHKKYFNSEIVISGNRDHYPTTELYETHEIPEAKTSFRFICSSQFIGKTAELIKLFEIMQNAYAGYVDQEAWHLLKAKDLASFHIDHNCRLFLNMTNVFESELDADFKLTETKIRPCSIHFGGAKGDDPNAKAMESIYQKWEQSLT